ncbi:hypothetical protein [Niallia taxi]|uniref:hypothetical protein n=1 Tax=Niallia taxi TaxID=2499688 RepID=UPI002E1FD726|nr:hypothetical protein [Niallia taxi]
MDYYNFKTMGISDASIGAAFLNYQPMRGFPTLPFYTYTITRDRFLISEENMFVDFHY